VYGGFRPRTVKDIAHSLVGPLDVPETEREFVFLLPVECDAVAALPVSGAVRFGACA
jgi:hypothetical protein